MLHQLDNSPELELKNKICCLAMKLIRAENFPSYKQRATYNPLIYDY